MKELFLMLGSVLPEEKIIEELEAAIAEYKLNPSQEARGKVGMFCMLFTTKEVTDKEGVMETLQRMQEVEKADQLINNRAKN